MATNENLIPIPGRLHSVASEGHAAGANEIYDDSLQKDQETINSELIQAVGTGGSVDSKIAAAKAEIIGNATSACDTLGEAEALISAETSARQSAISNIIGDAASDYNTLGKLEDKIQAEATRAEAAEEALDNRVDTLEDAVGTGGSVDSRISAAVATETTRAQATESNLNSGKADKATTLVGYGITDAYTKSETYTKTEVHGLVDIPHQNYVTVTSYSNLPNPGAADTIYRVSNYDGSTSQVDVTKYSEYAYSANDLTTPIFLCVKSQIGEVFDISVYNNNTKYADLAAALNGGANIPQSLQKGGMSVKFVQSSDNKYVQYRLMADGWSTNVDNWLSENLDDAPTFRSNNLLTSGTINKALCTNLGKIDFCKVIRVSGPAGYEFGYEASPTHFLTELFDISDFVSVTWKYHDESDDTYLVVYDENKNIIGAWGSTGGQRTILVSNMQTGAKYVRATFDWTNHSTIKDWALIGTDSNDVQTILWDESHLESEILNSINDLDSRVTALENPINDDSEKLFYEGSVEQPTLNSNRLNHDGSLISYGGNTYKTSKLIAVNYGDIITFTGATDGTSAPLIGYSKKEYGTTYFVEDLMPAAGLENDKLFTKSVKITNHNIKYVASCGYVKQGAYPFKVTCEAGHEIIEDMLVMSSLHNYYPNAMSKAGGFVQKYLGGEDVNIVLLGDSITAVANQKQNTSLDKIPCFMEHQNWCYWLWKYLYKNDNIIYRRYDYPSFFSYTGDFAETSINSIEPYNYISSNENAAFQFDWNLANYEKTNIILPKDGSQCYQGIKIEVLSNGAATDGIVEYYNGTTWVEANGVVLYLRLLADPDGTSTCRNMRHKFRRVGASGTVSIRVSKNGTEGYLQLWGVEQWNGQGMFISNAAWGGMATYELQSGHQTSLMGHRPDLVLFELTLVNNFGDRMYESNSKELMYNDFYDYIWGDRPDHTNALSLKALSNNWADWQVVLVVPHWRQQWVDGDNFKMTIEGTPVKYSALDCYNVVKGLIKSKNDLEYLDLGSNLKQEAIRRGWTLEQSYAGTTDETMESIKCFTQDTVHLNNLGSKIYGMYIAPIFDI